MLEQWKIKNFEPGKGAESNVFLPDYDDKDWLEIKAPGDVYDVLIKNKVIEDPFYDQNETKCQWVSEAEWWYRTQFKDTAMPFEKGERVVLVFEGIDTFATIWMNGVKIGQTENMFRQYEFDVTDHINSGDINTIAVCIDAALNHEDKSLPFESWGVNPERVSLRKAQYQYGWDWGPRLPGVGLWKPAFIQHRKKAAIADVHFYTLRILNEKKATISLDIDVSFYESCENLQLEVELYDADGNFVFQHISPLKGRDNIASKNITTELENPRLWWSNGLGDAHLYRLKIAVLENINEIDCCEKQVGVRTIELDQSLDYDEPGTRFFRFVLNGVPIFAKGANWIPADSFPGRMEYADYEKLIRKAKTANFNMLRIWGGGIYEHENFYQLCNELGILVWQDFMFACALYPEGPESFVENVKLEAEYQINRLKNHPCMALWCGNNENQWIHDKENWNSLNDYCPGNLYYHDILPKIVKEKDGFIPYWPGSPFGGNDYNSMADGDRHNWYAWHGDLPRVFGQEPKADMTPEGVTYLNYAKDQGRFISEFGMHASPVFETLKRCMPEDQLFFHSPSMDHHNKDFPKNKGDNLMISVTGLPNDLQEYIDYSMIAQAEGLKFAIEHFRRRMPHCSGTLFWQFNDCWPALSWSVVDYYGFEKAGYHYAKRAYSPVIVSFKESDNGTVQVWMTNDLLQTLDEEITLVHASFNGEKAWEKKVNINCPGNSSQVVFEIAQNELNNDAAHYLAVKSENNLFPANRYFFKMIKDLQLEKAVISSSVKVVNNETLEYELKSDKYACFVYFTFNDEQAVLSDNYFDLQPFERKTVTIHHKGSLVPDAVSIRHF